MSETMKFEELNIKPEILRAVEYMGFEEATPIQSQAIRVMESGVDMIGQAQTGTGKTASFWYSAAGESGSGKQKGTGPGAVSNQRAGDSGIGRNP